MPHEIELKLFLPDGAEARLANARLLKGTQPRRLTLDATYFDTLDRLLLRHAMALRLRRSGRQWVQTLKAAHSAHGGLSTRPEWELPARLVGGKPRLDLAALSDTPLPALLAQQRSRARLRPAFRVRVQRTVWQIGFRRSRIEVALDRGRIEAERKGQRVTAPVAELELELMDGRPGDLVAAALQLTGRGRSALALVPLVRGKAERGYRLVSGTPVPPAKASARGFVAQLQPDMASGAALRAIVAHGLDVLLANTEALRDAHAPEYVHQGRVALRRMRSAVRLLDRRHRDFPKTLAAELRWAARLLGAARDADVLLTQTLPMLLSGTPPALDGDTKQMLRQAAVQREAARSRVLAALATARYARLALRLQAWMMTPPPAGRTLRKLAARALARAHRRLFAGAEDFATLSSEERHRLRILAKRLRYALDVCSVALPREATQRYVEALARLQDLQGELNDLSVAAGLLEQLTNAPGLSALARERIAVRQGVDTREIERHLRAVHAAARPWAA
ncbi:MAG TPA: CHAD domain-containing protein [Burkholderiaceae bacterium]|nr:CHAD domain-containing protein [Burkholderiaceae bacterium]HQR69325.1 CHAD domain-containing protein [Burkholderiaceae bacterium]